MSELYHQTIIRHYNFSVAEQLWIELPHTDRVTQKLSLRQPKMYLELLFQVLVALSPINQNLWFKILFLIFKVKFRLQD